MENIITSLKEMEDELQEARVNLNAIASSKHFKTLFPPGEQTSIKEILALVEVRSVMMQRVMGDFEE